MSKAWIAALLSACASAPAAVTVEEEPAPATIALEVVDEAGAPIPAQVRLASRGAPIDAVAMRGSTGWRIRRQDFVVGPSERSIVVRSSSELGVPAGPIELTVTRGHVWTSEHRALRLRPGERRSLTIVLRRWSTRRERGWRCGDMHLHLARLHPDRDSALRELLASVDLDVAVLVDWSGRATGFAPGWGGWSWDGPLLAEEVRAERLLFHAQGWGRPDRACVLGLFGHRTPATGVSRYSAPAIVERVRAEGGLVSGTMGDVPTDAALLGGVAATEVLSHGEMHALDRWYALLNVGARIAAVAGSDTQGPSWPSTLIDYHAPPGSSRVCARVRGELTRETFLTAIAAGETFVTSGPTLELTVDGEPPGRVVNARGTLPVRVQMRAPLPPGGRIEVVVNGEVAESMRAELESVQLTLEHRFEESSWVAARLVGEARMPGGDRMLAHTSPVYVRVDGRDVFDEAAYQAVVPTLSEQDAIAASGRSTDQERELALEYVREARALLEARRAAASSVASEGARPASRR